MRRSRRAIIATLAAVFAVIAGISYAAREKRDPGRLTTRQEIALGGRAAGVIATQRGGLDPDPEQRKRVAMIGDRLVSNSSLASAPYRFAFHVLADAGTVAAFALPDGEVLVTDALLGKLRADDEVAGVLSHALAHIMTRDPSRHLEAAHAAPASDDDATMDAAAVRLAGLRFRVDEEIAADLRAVRLMSDAGYDPESFAVALQTLERAGAPVFFAMHPNPAYRVSRVRAAAAELRLSH